MRRLSSGSVGGDGTQVPSSRRRPAEEGSPRHVVAAAALAALVVAAPALAACQAVTSAAGSGSPEATGSPTPAAGRTAAAGSRPLAGSVREAAAAYWRLIDAGDYEAVAAAGVAGRPPSATAATDDIAAAHLVAVDAVEELAGSPGALLAQVQVFIKPDDVAGRPTPWGAAGEHTLFMRMQPAPGGGWLVEGWGTGP